MNAERINYIYIGTLLYILGCYGSLEWWQLGDYKVFLLCVLLVLLVSLRVKILHKFWGVSVCMIFFLLGAWAGSNVPPKPAQELQPYFQQNVLAYGSIAPESVKHYSYGTSFILRCEKSNGLSYSQNLRVFTKEKDIPQMGKVWCSGELLPLNTLRNPGGFDGERWNYLQGLGGRLRKAKVEVVSEEGSKVNI